MAGIHGLGAELVLASFTSSGGSTDHTIVELTNIGEITMSADDIDVSSLADRFKQYTKGLIEPGEVAFTGNYMSTDGPKVLEYLASDATTAEAIQRINVPGHFTMTFPGYVKGFGFGIPYDGKVSMSGSIKISGLATIHASTST